MDEQSYKEAVSCQYVLLQDTIRPMKLFNGYQVAYQREQMLHERVVALKAAGSLPHIAAMVFQEDSGSRLYTTLKQQAAERVGIAYTPSFFSVAESLDTLLKWINQANTDASITGIIIQKPWKQTWLSARGGESSREVPDTAPGGYSDWWRTLTRALAPDKDVDGLHPSLRTAIQAGTWKEQGRVLPATVEAVRTALAQAYRVVEKTPQELAHAVIGASDLLGYPLSDVLHQENIPTTLFRKKEFLAQLGSEDRFTNYPVIISATGTTTIAKADQIAAGSIIIDVGEPRGDVKLSALETKLAFATPVPGGIGPVTVVALLENAVRLLE